MNDVRVPLWRIAIRRKNGVIQNVEIGGKAEAKAAARRVLKEQPQVVSVYAYCPAHMAPGKKPGTQVLVSDQGEEFRRD